MWNDILLKKRFKIYLLYSFLNQTLCDFFRYLQRPPPLIGLPHPKQINIYQTKFVNIDKEIVIALIETVLYSLARI